MQQQLQEVLLSSSPALTCIHDLKTGALLTSFKAASSSNGEISRDSTSASSTTSQSSSSSSQYRKTVDTVLESDGQGGIVVSAVLGKAAITIWSFQREAPLQRLLTPTKIACLAISKDGTYLAVGGFDGRLFLWELSSGNLLASFDAHYRTVTCLAWTDDGAALISASDDAAAHVWSLPVMLASPDNPLLPVIPYASLTDHTLPITSLHVSFGSFPRTRILTGSLDGTLKLWDLTLARSKSSTLLSTFSVGSANEQITHVAMDSLERTVFVACREPKGGRSRVVRVDLYRRLRRGETQQEEEEEGDDNDEDAEAEGETDRWEAPGGGGRGDIVRLDDSGQKAHSSSSSSNNNQTKASEATQQVGTLSVPGRTYVLPSSPPAENSISSLHLSPLSSTLVLGTSSGQIHVLSLPSMQSIRVIVPLAGSTSVSPGAQPLHLVRSFLRPVDLVSRSGGGAGAGKDEQIQPRAVAGQLSRTVLQQNSAGNTGTTVVMIKLNGLTSSDAGEVEDLIDPPTWNSIGSPTSQAAYSQTPSTAFASDALSGSNSNNSSGQQNLQEENARLREQLARSIALNERIWEGVVDGVLGHRGGPAGSIAPLAAGTGKSQHQGMEMDV